MIDLKKTCAAMALLLTWSLPAMAIEEPAYEVVTTADEFELRRYAPYIVAETTVDGDLGRASGKAFRILAGYIFGANESSEKMKMTAPVESRPLPKVGLNTATRTADQQYRFAFVMESRYTMDTLPEPADARVTLREVPARTVAAHRFSGRTSNGNHEKHEQRLLDALEANGIATLSDPTLARYDGPMKPWFMRRNEVLIEVEVP